MTSSYPNYQNPSVCCFLLQVKAIAVVFKSLEDSQIFGQECKNEMSSGSCSQISSW